MGVYFDVQGGGGTYPARPSPASNSAAAKCLREKARIPEEAVLSVEGRSVAAVVQVLVRPSRATRLRLNLAHAPSHQPPCTILLAASFISDSASRWLMTLSLLGVERLGSAEQTHVRFPCWLCPRRVVISCNSAP
jgi:hypothetical protein